jgi:micrococcal nuclease
MRVATVASRARGFWAAPPVLRLALWAWLALCTAALGQAERALVSSVVDGDTIRVDLGGAVRTVRLIGVDTPELGDRRDRHALPQPYAREAADFTRRALGGQRVRLEYERRDRLDRYGRTLAYVFLEDGTFFNRELVRSGHARVFLRFPFRYRKQFRADEAAARRAGRGLWGHSHDGS